MLLKYCCKDIERIRLTRNKHLIFVIPIFRLLDLKASKQDIRYVSRKRGKESEKVNSSGKWQAERCHKLIPNR